jgi:hypothetical protein
LKKPLKAAPLVQQFSREVATSLGHRNRRVNHADLNAPDDQCISWRAMGVIHPAG